MTVSKKKFKRNQVSVGITWIDSKLIFKESSKMDKRRMWLGVCHATHNIMSFCPYDFKRLTIGLTTITIEPDQKYCEKAYECVSFNCPLNRFDKRLFLAQFGESSGFSLALPNDFGSKPLWFNDGKFLLFWERIVYLFGTHPEGGLLEFSEENYERIIKV